MMSHNFHSVRLVYQLPSRNDSSAITENITEQIFSKILFDNSFAILLLNRDSKMRNMTLEWNYLGIDSSECLMLRDVWKKEFIGQYKNSFSVEIDSHHVVMLTTSSCTN